MSTDLLSPFRPRLSPPLERMRVRLADGARTTLHIASYNTNLFRPRIVVLERPQPLAQWCRRNGVEHAVVGGFFKRPEYVPLGQLRVDGRVAAAVPFDAPWHEIRACVHIDGSGVSLGRRDQLGAVTAGDLLQAGPLLIGDGEPLIEEDVDPEGFSAASHQFDSDITRGRYPRAALALAGDRVLAVACDGRTGRDAGMTLRELAHTLLHLGASEALNLDGGGSASLVHDGKLRNRPREEHGVDLLGGRPIVTAIIFERP